MTCITPKSLNVLGRAAGEAWRIVEPWTPKALSEHIRDAVAYAVFTMALGGQSNHVMLTYYAVSQARSAIALHQAALKTPPRRVANARRPSLVS